MSMTRTTPPAAYDATGARTGHSQDFGTYRELGRPLVRGYTLRNRLSKDGKRERKRKMLKRV